MQKISKQILFVTNTEQNHTKYTYCACKKAYQKYYSTSKVLKNIPFVTAWVSPHDIILNEICQTQKVKCCMISLSYQKASISQKQRAKW